MKRVLRVFALALALFSLTPISVQAQQVLIPVGTVIGLQLKDDTVTVAAFDDRCPAARNAGMQIGDELIRIDDTAITSTEDVRSALNRCDGNITMTLRRNGTVSTLHVTDSHLRFVRHAVDWKVTRLRFIPIATHGAESFRLFDFEVK